MQTYAFTLDVEPAKTNEKTMSRWFRGQVLSKSQAVWNRSARYRGARLRSWFRFMPWRKGKTRIAIEVRAHDLEDAQERASRLFRPTIRDALVLVYEGAYNGFWCKYRKTGRA